MASSSANPVVIVSADRSRDVSTNIAELQRMWHEASAPDANLSKIYDNLHVSWWQEALRIHRNGEHHSERYHVLDWGVFLREKIPTEVRQNVLKTIFRDDHRAAKEKCGVARLQNAANALGLEDVIEIHVELGREVCTSTRTIKGISTLRTSVTHERIEPEVIRTAIREKLLAEKLSQPGPIPAPPLPSVSVVNQVIAELRASAPQKQKKQSAKRRRSAAVDGDEDEERPRVRRRRSGDGIADDDEADEIGRSFVQTFSELEGGRDSLATRFLGPDVTGDDIIQFRPRTPSPLAGFEDGEEPSELDIAARQKEIQEKQDSHLREQLEICSRLLQKGKPSPEATGDPALDIFFETLHAAARGVMYTAKQGSMMAHQEARRLEREEPEPNGGGSSSQKKGKGRATDGSREGSRDSSEAP